MISVIIPVYNVEKYIDDCVKSIINQTYKNLQIILIDDGSSDSSGEKCDFWANIDNRITVFHKANDGLGMARNSGLEIIEGDYVSFVDSDDILEVTTYEKCIQEIEKNNADICYFNFCRFSNKSTIYNHAVFPNRIYDKEKIIRNLMPMCYGENKNDKFKIGSSCMGIYKTSIIKEHNLKFPSEKELISEDYIFTADICYYSSKIVFISEPLYKYRITPGSLTNRYREDRFEKIILFYKNRIEDIRNKNLGNECVERARLRFLDMVFANLYINNDSSELKYIEKKENYKKICSSQIFRDELKLKSVRTTQKILRFPIMCKSYSLFLILNSLKNLLRYKNI